MLAPEGECLGASGGNHRRERDVYGGPRRYSHAAAKTKDWIEDAANSIGERLAVNYRDRRANGAPTPKETRPVRLQFYGASGLTFDDRDMPCPDLGGGGRARAPRGPARARRDLE